MFMQTDVHGAAGCSAGSFDREQKINHSMQITTESIAWPLTAELLGAKPEGDRTGPLHIGLCPQ